MAGQMQREYEYQLLERSCIGCQGRGLSGMPACQCCHSQPEVVLWLGPADWLRPAMPLLKMPVPGATAALFSLNELAPEGTMHYCTLR